MGKRQIDNSKDKVKEFLELWVKFNQLYKDAMKKSTITQEEEQSFLETKSIIARKFQALADSLSIDRSTIERTYDIINQILSLKGISTLSEPELKKIDNDWHESYIFLNRLLGHLEAKREDVSNAQGTVVGRVSRSIVRTVMYVLFFIVLISVILYIAFILGLFELYK